MSTIQAGDRVRVVRPSHHLQRGDVCVVWAVVPPGVMVDPRAASCGVPGGTTKVTVVLAPDSNAGAWPYFWDIDRFEKEPA